MVDREQVRKLVTAAVDEALGSPAPAAASARPASGAGGTWSLPPFYVSAASPTARDGLQRAEGRTLRPGATRRVAIGSDHGGFQLKRNLMELLKELRWDVRDCGTYSSDSCDYPDFAIKVGQAVQSGTCALGIMIDGAGIGSAMALNKLPGIRAATVHSEATAINSREHNDANVLVLGSAQMHAGHARRITRIWLATPHAGGRHARRVEKINALDARG